QFLEDPRSDADVASIARTAGMSDRGRFAARLQTALAALAIAATVGGAEARAAVSVVPNAQAAAEGNSSSYGPFFDSSGRYQQVFNASQFPATGLLTITQIAFRPDGSVGGSTLSILGTSVHVELSTTARTAATLSTTFASNVGADHQTVYDGAVTSAPVTGPG